MSGRNKTAKRFIFAAAAGVARHNWRVMVGCHPARSTRPGGGTCLRRRVLGHCAIIVAKHKRLTYNSAVRRTAKQSYRGTARLCTCEWHRAAIAAAAAAACNRQPLPTGRHDHAAAALSIIISFQVEGSERTECVVCVLFICRHK